MVKRGVEGWRGEALGAVREEKGIRGIQEWKPEVHAVCWFCMKPCSTLVCDTHTCLPYKLWQDRKALKSGGGCEYGCVGRGLCGDGMNVCVCIHVGSWESSSKEVGK